MLPGTMPGPMLFGSAFDAACTVWQETCGERGSCFFYNTKYLGYYMLVTAGSIKFGACVFMLLAWKLYKTPKPVTEEIYVEGEDKKDSDYALQGEGNSAFSDWSETTKL